MKESISLEKLCNRLPAEFIQYLNYCRNLKFKEKPDYNQLKKIFKELYDRKGYEYRKNKLFDW
jgi:hypothetical protein